MIELRSYQVQAVDAVLARLAEDNSTLLILPTGTGKTCVFGEIARRWLVEHPFDWVLVLAHREELINQARNELSIILSGKPQIEMAGERADHGNLSLFGVDGEDVSWSRRVVVGSVQTLAQPKRIAQYDNMKFGLIIWDEAHHVTPSNKTYWNVWQHFKGSKHLGVTASPVRADGIALGAAFDSVAMEYPIDQAVEEGYLVEPKQQFVIVESLDLSRIKSSKGDFSQVDLSRAMTADEATSWKIASATLEHCGDEPTIIFTCPRPKGERVSQGEQIANCLNELKPGSAVHLTGEVPREERRWQLERYSRGEFQFLIGCSLFTEGFNEPRISRVVMARPTKSIVYYAQAFGRGTRTLRGTLTPEMDREQRIEAIAKSAKPHMVCLDFVGNSGCHKLVTLADIFAGEYPPAVVEKAKLMEGTTAKPIRERLEEAAVEVERERREEEERIQRAKARVNYTAQNVDPFGHGSSANRDHGRREMGDPCSSGQRSWIEQHGGILNRAATFGEAAQVIQEMKKRYKEKLCSMKQEKILKKFGLVDGPIPKLHAGAMLDLLQARNWETPRYEIDRKRLSIKPEPGGFKLVVRDDSRGMVEVGPLFRTPDEVRQAYAGFGVAAVTRHCVKGAKMIGEFVLVRTRSAGVHCGILQEAAGTAVVLADSRRIWRWRGANSLNEISLRGVDQEYTRISEPVEKILLTEAVEVILCTKESRDNLEESRWGN